jgi:hypothetical protein
MVIAMPSAIPVAAPVAIMPVALMMARMAIAAPMPVTPVLYEFDAALRFSEACNPARRWRSGCGRAAKGCTHC